MDHHNVSAKLKTLASYGHALMRQGTEKLSKLNYKGYRITPVHVGVGAVAVALAVVALIAHFIKKYQSQIYYKPLQSKALLTANAAAGQPTVPDPKPLNPGEFLGAGSVVQPPVLLEYVDLRLPDLPDSESSSDVDEQVPDLPDSESSSDVDEQVPDLSQDSGSDEDPQQPPRGGVVQLPVFPAVPKEGQEPGPLISVAPGNVPDSSESSSVEQQFPRPEPEANKLEPEEFSGNREPSPPPNLTPPPKVFKVLPLQVGLQSGIEQRLQKKAQDSMATFLPKIAEVARDADSQKVAALAAEARALLDTAQSEGWHKKVYQGYQVQRYLRDLIAILELHQEANEFTETNRKSLENLKSPDVSSLIVLRRSLEYLDSCRRFIAELDNEKEVFDERDNLKIQDNLYIVQFGSKNILDKEIEFIIKDISIQLENLKFDPDTYESLSTLVKSAAQDSEEIKVITEWLTTQKQGYDREFRISTAYKNALLASEEMSSDDLMGCLKTLRGALATENVGDTEVEEVNRLIVRLSVAGRIGGKAHAGALEFLKKQKETTAPQLAPLSRLVENFIRKNKSQALLAQTIEKGIKGTKELLNDLTEKANSLEDHEGKFKKLYAEYAQLSTDHFVDTLPWKEALDHCRVALDGRSFKLGGDPIAASVLMSYEEPSQAPVIDEEMTSLLSNRDLDEATKSLMAENLSRLGEMKGSGTAEEQESETWIYKGASGEKVELKTRAFPEELAARYVVCFQGSDQAETIIDSASVELDREKWAGLIEQALPGVGCSAEPPMIAGVLNSLWREGGLAQTWLKSNQVLNRANQRNTQLRLTQDEVIRVDIKLEKDDLVITHQVNYGLGLQDHSTGQASPPTPLDAHAVHLLTSRIPLNDPTKISVEWQAQPFKRDEKISVEAVKAEVAEPQLEGEGVRFGDSLIGDTEDFREYLRGLPAAELRDYKYALSLQAAQEAFPTEPLDTPLGHKVEELRTILNSTPSTHYERYAAFRGALMVILNSQDYKDQRDLAIKAKEKGPAYPDMPIGDSFVVVESEEDAAFKTIMNINFARYRNNKMDVYTEVLVERALIAGREKLSQGEHPLPALLRLATPAERIEAGIRCMKAAGQTEMGESASYVKWGKFKGFTNLSFDPGGETNVLFTWPEVEIYGEKRAWLRFGTPTAGAVVNPDMIAYTDELELRGEKHVFFNLQDRNPKPMSHAEYWTGSPEHLRSLAIEKELNAKKSSYAVTLPHDTDFYHQRGEFANEDQVGNFKTSLMWEMKKSNGGFYFPPSLTGTGSSESQEFFNGLVRIFDDVHRYVYDGKKTLTAEERRNFIEITYVFIILKILVDSGATSFNISCKDAIDRGGVLNALLLFVIAVLNGEEVSSEEFQKKLDTFAHGPAFMVKTQGVISSRSPQLLGPLKQLFDRKEVLKNSPLKMEYLQKFRPEYLENPVGKAKPLGDIIEGIVTYALKNPERSEGSSYQRAHKMLKEVIEIISDPKVRDPLLDYAKGMLDQRFRSLDNVARQRDSTMDTISKEIKEISNGIFKLLPEVNPPNVHTGTKITTVDAVTKAWCDHRELGPDKWGSILKSSEQLLDKASSLITSPQGLEMVTDLDDFYRLLALQLKNLNSVLVSAGSKEQEADPFKALSGRAEKLSSDLKTKRNEQLAEREKQLQKVPASEEAEAPPSSEYLKIQLQYDLVQGVRKVAGRTYDSLFADCYVKKYFAPYAEGIKDPRTNYKDDIYKDTKYYAPPFYTNLVAEMEMGPMDQPDPSIQKKVIDAFDMQTKALYKKLRGIDSKEQIKSSPDRKEWAAALSAAWEIEGFPGQIRNGRSVTY